MSRCPFARWEPIPAQARMEAWPEERRIQKKTQLILHSAAGGYPGSLAEWAKKDYRLFSTFFVLWDGSLIQLVDSAFQANTNASANERAISVETEDHADPDHLPWTTAQVDTLVRLAEWVHAEHGVPLVPCPAHDAPGIGFHTMFGETPRLSPWLGLKPKTCPGLARIPQFFDTVLVRLGHAVQPDELEQVLARWSRRPTLPGEGDQGTDRRAPQRRRRHEQQLFQRRKRGKT